MKYWLIGGWNLDELEEKVNAKIREGWVPQGGLTSTYHQTNCEVVYAQAMVKKLSKPEKMRLERYGKKDD